MEIMPRVAIRVMKAEGETLVRRLARSRYLADRGIEVYTVPADEPMILVDPKSGDHVREPAVNVMVRAETTDFAVGVGVGFVVAISEGLS